jgi:hypothetical protein
MDHSHLVSNESDVLKDDIEQAVCQKVQFLYAVFEDRLNADQLKSLSCPYGENYNTYAIYHEMKKHALAFTKEQLLYETLLQYIEALQIPGKWSGTLFNVVLHWLVCANQGIHVARTDWTTANANPPFAAKYY